MTICGRCGESRESIAAECPSCGHFPSTHQELAKAILLTTQFDSGTDSFGMPQANLDAIAQQIRAGRSPHLSTYDLSRHEEAVKAVLGRQLYRICGTFIYRLFWHHLAWFGVIVVLLLIAKFLLR